MNREQVDKLVIAYADSCETEHQIEEWFNISGESNFLRNIKDAISEALISCVEESDQYKLSCCLGDGDVDGVFNLIQRQNTEPAEETAGKQTDMKCYKLEFAGEATVMARNRGEAEFKLQRGQTVDKYIEIDVCYESDMEAGR